MSPSSSTSGTSTPTAPSRLMNHLNLGSSQAKGKTRGGAQKRTFKPTVPVGKPLHSQSTPDKPEDPTPPSKKTKKSEPNNKKESGKNVNSRPNYRREEKKFVQLESAVFTGITPGQGSLSFRRSTGTSNGLGFSAKSSSLSSSVSKVKTQTCQDKTTKEGYLRDDFVVDSSEDEDSDYERKRSRRFKVKPIGWNTLFENEDKKKAVSDEKPEQPSSADAASMLTEGRALLIQLPDKLIPRLNGDEEDSTKKLTLEAIGNRNGFLGTLKVYESGRLEFFHDDDGDVKPSTSSAVVVEDDSVYEVIRSEEVVTSVIIKQEDGSEVVVPVGSQAPQFIPRNRQEVIALDLNEREAVSVGKVNLAEKLIVLPKILNNCNIRNGHLLQR